MSARKVVSTVIVIVLVALLGYLSAPFGVPVLELLLTWRPPTTAALSILMSGGLEAWVRYGAVLASTGRGLALLASWMLLVGALIALYAYCQGLLKPSRISDKDSPLGSAKIISNPVELRRKLDFWNGRDEPSGVGLVIGGGKHGYYFNHAVPHWLTVAKTGAGKTQLMVLETLHLLMAKGVNILATGKSELVELTGDKAVELGYNRIIFDLTGYPGASSFNPVDLVAEYAEAGNIDAAQKTARQTAADLIPLGGETNTYFPKAARSALTAAILIVAFADIPREQKNIASVYEIIMRGTTGAGTDTSAPLKDYIRHLGAAHPAYGPAADFLSDGGLTTAGKNVLSTLKEAITIFGDEGIRSITSVGSYSMHEILRNKSIVYFHLLEEGDPYQVVYTCFFNQFWRVAQEEAKRNGGRLPHETVILGDEWGNLGRVECTGQIATLGRSMKFHLYAFVQNLKQLQVYCKPGDNGAGRDKILGSIGGKVALSLATPEDGAYFTKLCGKHTVRTHSQGNQQSGTWRTSNSNSYSEQADDLIHEWEWNERVAVRDGSIAVIGGENASPGREGVFKLPVTYAHKTPAGAFFGLGAEEYEHEKRMAFVERMGARVARTDAFAQFWCPDFEAFKTDDTAQSEVFQDEFTAWD